jgi:hypothetical protein
MVVEPYQHTLDGGAVRLNHGCGTQVPMPPILVRYPHINRVGVGSEKINSNPEQGL